MTKRRPKALASVERFDEKQFYLDEFRSKTLLFSIPADQLATSDDYEALAASVRELLANDTRVLILIDTDTKVRSERVLGRLRRRLGRGLAAAVQGSSAVGPRRVAAFGQLDPRVVAANASPRMARLWTTLRRYPLFVGVSRGRRLSVHDLAQQMAVRLRVHKLVLVEAGGGLSGEDGKPLSFMDENLLGTLLSAGQAEWAGLADRRATLDAVRSALVGGVTSVNVCTLAGTSRELFTYEGSGTLFTLADYCKVHRLGIDDFEEVETLLERGQREGLLKPRSPREIAAIIVDGYGATIGAHHLAGFCALVSERYRAAKAGEIVGLYTITRFKGEGVGAKLVAQVVADARGLGLSYVFACTTEERAQSFFERQGFVRVTTKDVPAVKWRSYDPRRKAALSVFRLNLK